MFPAEVFRETLLKVVAWFDRHKVRYHLTGGLTSVAYGEPRMTQGLDLVIDRVAAATSLEALLADLAGADFLYDEQEIRRAVAQRDMFQLIDQVESLKLDIYARELIPGELDRSVSVEVFDGFLTPIVSRADAAVSKLIWVARAVTRAGVTSGGLWGDVRRRSVRMSLTSSRSLACQT